MPCFKARNNALSSLTIVLSKHLSGKKIAFSLGCVEKCLLTRKNEKAAAIRSMKKWAKPWHGALFQQCVLRK